MKGLKPYMIIGIVFVSILGTLLHFAYNFSGNNIVIGLFTPVNESIWERTKLIFFPSEAISHCEAIFHVRRTFHKSARIYFIEKRLVNRQVFFLEEPNDLDA